jgi:hypothetical protein
MSAHKLPRLLAALTAGALGASGCGGSTKSPPTRSSSESTTSASVASSTAQPAAPSPAATSHTVTATAGGVSATMHGGTHRPRVDRPWPIRFAVTSGGHGVRASVEYEYVFAGQVVAHRSHYTFTGHFSDVFMWPSSAVGYPLTFRAVIRSRGSTLNLDYQVQVTR